MSRPGRSPSGSGCRRTRSCATTARAGSRAGGCRARSGRCGSCGARSRRRGPAATRPRRARHAWTIAWERGVTAQRGQIFRKPSGLWAIRWRDARGPSAGSGPGFRTKAEAREVLEEELRRVRLGPLHRPNATLRELTDAYVAQYDAAPSTVALLRDNMRPALARFGDEPIGALTVQRIATWRASVPEGKRYRSHRALRQVLQAAVRWRWIEDNPAVQVKNPEPRAGRDRPVRLVGGARCDRRRARRRSTARSSCSWRGRACGRRRPSARSGATSTSSGGCSWSGARSRRAG